MFRGKGWKDHAGVMGWGGWVRRREMVRLRGTKAEEPKGRAEGVGDEERGKTWPSRSLKGLILGDEVDGDVERVLRSLGRVPLDRRKLDTWRRWLEEDDEDGHQKLQTVLNDQEAVSSILFLGTSHLNTRLTGRYPDQIIHIPIVHSSPSLPF